jgi:NAD(P)-dependent dehydrogenase (short-subunit alcohol dehydrogenase family)
MLASVSENCYAYLVFNKNPKVQLHFSAQRVTGILSVFNHINAAVSNFTQWLAVLFSKVGIRVNALAPGFFLTDQNRALLTTENNELTPRGNSIIDQTPMGRFGEPEDLVSTTLYLCDEASSFVTGVVIPIDGGFSAYSGV